MIKFKNWRAPVGLVATALLISLTTGCQALGTLAYVMFPNEERIMPPFELVTERKEEKRVAVVVYTSSQLLWQYESLDEELGRALAREIETREERLSVVSARKIQAWKDTNPRWAEVEMREVGEEFDCDYVVWVDISTFSLHETKNQWLLKGRADATLRVFDLNKNDVIVEQDYEEEFPKNRPVPVAELASKNEFKRQLVKQLAKKLSWFITPHHPNEEFGM